MERCRDAARASSNRWDALTPSGLPDTGFAFSVMKPSTPLILPRASRRHFLRQSAVATGATLAFPYVGNVLGANDRIQVACIGVGGKGSSDTDDAARCGGTEAPFDRRINNAVSGSSAKAPRAPRYRDTI